jgi:deoxyhypusine synthase
MQSLDRNKVMPRSRKTGKKSSGYPFPEIRDLVLNENSSVNDIMVQMKSSGGFQARYLAESVDILEEMCKDEKCVKFLSFPAAIISTGNRGVIKELDHDLARSYKAYHSGGEFAMDDIVLEQKGFHRLGNVLIPTDNYGPLVEEKVQKVLLSMYSKGEKEPSTQLLCHRLGESIYDEGSILHWAARNEIPVFIPGITDGAVGSQCWLFYQTHKDFKLDLLKDEQAISDIVGNRVGR